MSDDFELIESQDIELNNLQVYQQDKAMIDMQIATAKRYPRNLQRAIQNAITIVTLDIETADSCMYSLKKGKTITGPSVVLAKIIAQQMGNMRIENRVVGYDATHVTCEAVCFDLERNFAIRTQIKKSIVGSSGRYSEDMATITGNAGNAVAMRNAIFSVVDASIVKKVYDAAKKKITGDVSDENKLIARKNIVINGLKNTYLEYKLTDEEICNSIGKKVIEHINADDLIILIGFEKSLKDTETTLDSIFRPKEKFVSSSTSKKYPDDKSNERILSLILSCKDKKSLEKLQVNCNTNESRIAYDEAFKKLKS